PQSAPNADEFAKWWDELGSESADKAEPAMKALALAPHQAIALLREKLHQKGDAERIERLIDDLGSADFAAREAATRTLREIGKCAEPRLKTRHANASAESRQFIASLLKYVEQSSRPRFERAVEVLEWIGSTEARAALKVAAESAPDLAVRDDAA